MKKGGTSGPDQCEMKRPKYTLEKEKLILSELVEKEVKKMKLSAEFGILTVIFTPNIVLCFPVIMWCGAILSAVVSQLK